MNQPPQNFFHDPERDDYDEGPTPREDFLPDPDVTVPLTGFQQFISVLTTIGLLSMFLTCGGPVALIFSVPAWIFAKRELLKIDRGEADPSNRRVIRSNYETALGTTMISLLVSPIWGYVLWNEFIL